MCSAWRCRSAGKAEENRSKIRQYLAKAMEAYDKVRLQSRIEAQTASSSTQAGAMPWIAGLGCSNAAAIHRNVAGRCR